ncbi:MAG TPA: S41 family peptidase, partial [Myxococcota bacterium]
TSAALQAAGTDGEAAAALLAFVAAFHDGHLTKTSAPATTTTTEPPWPPSSGDAMTACASYGYQQSTPVQFSLPIETLAGFTLLNDGWTDAFRGGVIDVDDVTIGVVRVPRFRTSEYPALCLRVHAALKAAGGEPTRESVGRLMNHEFLVTLAKRLEQLKKAGAAVLVVDVGGNGGGNDLGDWAARLFTDRAVHSPVMLIASGPTAQPYFDVQLKALRAASTTTLSARSRQEVDAAITSFSRLQKDAAADACDLSWVWKEQRTWGQQGCTRLTNAGFASGPRDFVEKNTLDAAAASSVYWAAEADVVRGAWTGPSVVLVDGKTASAAELFTVLMKDELGALVLGTKTAGMGCGFVDVDGTVVLPRSRLAFRVPNCVRLRKGTATDDVAGVVPDVSLVPAAGESSRATAARVLKAVRDAVHVTH